MSSYKVFVDLNGGGLGNILLMHHAGYALAKNMGGSLIIRHDYGCNKRININSYQPLFQHVKLGGIQEAIHILEKPIQAYTEPSFMYNELPCVTNGSIILRGYFQSYKYFDSYRLEIRNQLISNIQDKYNTLLQKHTTLHSSNSDTVCIHIRRGDYVELQHCHCILPISYYTKSMELLTQNITKKSKSLRFIVFSDDLEYVKNIEPFNTLPNVYFEDEADSVKCLLLMSLCDHFIIANSSYSLNAYFLRQNEDALLCCPYKWFGPQGPQYKISDIVPPNANIINY